MKNIILYLILINSIIFAVDFVPSKHDKNHNYLFESYENKSINGAGIKDENIAVPDFTVSEEILNTFLYALPEGVKANISHPEYFPQQEPDIVITKDADAFVTFYHEGAGYRNTLGYYTYGANTGRDEPQTRQDLLDHGVIIYPNTSFTRSGGMLSYGTTVSLGQLEAGTKVVFFVVSNGWTGQGIRSTDWVFASKSSLNLEYDSSSTKQVPDHKHVALLWSNVGKGNILLMGFEDILRTHYSCDHDFNDVLFSFSTNPMDALDEENGSFAKAPSEVDTDNDGVSDAFDEFENDPQRAYVIHYPSQDDKASLLFEDLWPAEGDYDMNDMALDIHIMETNDSQSKVKDIDFDIKLKANGAAYKNGFAIQINSNISNIESAQFFLNDEMVTESKLSADGDKTIITFFEHAVDEFKKMNSYMTFATTYFDNNLCDDPYNRFINVCLNRPKVEFPHITGKITFTDSVDLMSPPYNPFIIVDKGDVPYNEVHLPNYMPTSKVDMNFFNTRDDDSDLDIGRSYKTADDKPWALLIPTSFSYPIERADISEVYKYYNSWVESGGEEYQDWYIHTKTDENGEPYADPDRIIQFDEE